MEQINIDFDKANSSNHKRMIQAAVRIFLLTVLVGVSFGGCFYKTVEFTSLEELAQENPKILSAVDKQNGKITFNNYGARYKREGGSITVLSADGDTFHLEPQKVDKLITSEELGEQFYEDRLPELVSVLLHRGSLIFSGQRGFYYDEEKKELTCRTDRDIPFSANISEIKEFYYKEHSFISSEQLNSESISKVKKVFVTESDLQIDVKKIWHDRGIEYIAGVSTESKKIFIPKENLISFRAELSDEVVTTLVWVVGTVTTATLAVMYFRNNSFGNQGRGLFSTR